MGERSALGWRSRPAAHARPVKTHAMTHPAAGKPKRDRMASSEAILGKSPLLIKNHLHIRNHHVLGGAVLYAPRGRAHRLPRRHGRVLRGVRTQGASGVAWKTG